MIFKYEGTLLPVNVPNGCIVIKLSNEVLQSSVKAHKKERA